MKSGYEFGQCALAAATATDQGDPLAWVDGETEIADQWIFDGHKAKAHVFQDNLAAESTVGINGIPGFLIAQQRIASKVGSC